MPTAAPFSHFTRRRLAAFALLVVVTLLAFLVVLLVGLASVTRVETSVASNTQRQAQAREHALLALNLAVAHLQKYAGPDQRVTATADALSKTNAHYTGVWNSTTTDVTPLTWLVSGNEVFSSDGTNDPLVRKPASTLTTSGANPTGAELVGKNSSGIANDVVAPLVPITAAGIPGTAASATPTIGRYAWWVGDQGVKAPVANADNVDDVIYAPFDFSEPRGRIRQQLPLGAGAFDTTNKSVVFEPRDSNNSSLVSKDRVTAFAQLAFLKNITGGATGTKITQSKFHAWSAANFAVLANSKSGGLRQDLSLNPALLGSEFANWANYSAYMEMTPTNVQDMPSYASNSVARRYRIIPPSSVGSGISNAIAPVLCFCLLNFNCQTTSNASGLQPLQARVRAIIGLWNPYTSAFVPPASPDEDLRVEITGLPQVDFADGTGSVLASLQLEQMFAPALKIPLPWTANNATITGLAAQPDFQSWLPGRVYYWTSVTDATGETSIFYHKTLVGVSGGGYFVRADPAGQKLPSNTTGEWIVRRSTQLTIRLFHGSDSLPLATYTSPQFQAFPDNTPVTASSGTAQFGFLFRLNQNHADGATEKWLKSAGCDPRDSAPSSSDDNSFFLAGGQGPDPTQYAGTPPVTNDSLLLERTMGPTGQSYNEDVPVFELPRTPLLSLGAVQHLALPGQRPFSIGNSWGAGINLNGFTGTSVFDQFYFSGLETGVTPPNPNGTWVTPNVRLKVLAHDVSGNHVSPDIVRLAPKAKSSKYLLASAVFNLNSVNPDAWAAVLRSSRVSKLQEFSFLDADSSTGTASDSALDAIPRATPNLWEPSAGDAVFFRYSQSAQETYKSEAGQSIGSSAGVTPPSTELFRRGVIKLTAAQVTLLAKKIAEAVNTRQSTDGPFRSLEEFLAPIAGGPSLIEQAIIDADAEGAQINTDATGALIEFSSQWLTQADIMTALAPVLFARSDTFVVRAYGEAVNPITNATEGRAWCEATVQRVPEYFNAAADDAAASPDALTDPQNLNQTLGRRFKIVSFRWLTRSDI